MEDLSRRAEVALGCLLAALAAAMTAAEYARYLLRKTGEPYLRQ